ncbi:hypothetical protein RIF29_37127 [Crotalaria pallida]|uniref:Uncharacterized protein n=1 Tax=Crotalaria pallida TaxID=3830 RepID=A0AAN9EC04_CROPI
MPASLQLKLSGVTIFLIFLLDLWLNFFHLCCGYVNSTYDLMLLISFSEIQFFNRALCIYKERNPSKATGHAEHLWVTCLDNKSVLVLVLIKLITTTTLSFVYLALLFQQLIHGGVSYMHHYDSMVQRIAEIQELQINYVALDCLGFSYDILYMSRQSHDYVVMNNLEVSHVTPLFFSVH